MLGFANSELAHFRQVGHVRPWRRVDKSTFRFSAFRELLFECVGAQLAQVEVIILKSFAIAEHGQNIVGAGGKPVRDQHINLIAGIQITTTQQIGFP